MRAPDSTSAKKIIFIEQLSELIGKTPTTIRTCTTNKKYQHLIPLPFKLPNSRRLCWYLGDVKAWMAQGRAATPKPRRPRGRPTKKEQHRTASVTTKEGGKA